MSKIIKTITALGTLLVLMHACMHEPLPRAGNHDVINNDTIPEEDSCEPGRVYFVNDVLPILTSSCIHSGCHSGASPEKGLYMDRYADVSSMVDPGDPGGSKLYRRITDTDIDKRMPYKPYDALTPEQINTIRTWIAQGAKNDSCTECNAELSKFTADIWPIFRDNCRSCHSGASPRAGISFTGYAGIYPHAISGRILSAIKHEPGFEPMPYQRRPLSDCKIQQIEKWVAEGAQDN